MVSCLEQRNCADLIHWASEHQFPVPGKITQIEELELSEAEQRANAQKVLGLGRVGFLLLCVLAEGILAPGFDRVFNHLSVRRNHRDIHTLERNFIPWFHDHPLPFRNALVGLPHLRGARVPRRFGRLAMIVKLVDRDQF